ncbi:hypothetical protein AK812_SmicGene9323 [Symbiodinium microadriaticum]|uniref:BTB domain-containing protein n=1 Tax=Symbiodinium microadriaticum TaxID=2951 RepID=A0A1Q9EIP2_SYMMI|nr:hypothetical protein AK812_SmicGene9323 [Symbiodinium microadriaticum]
MMLLVYHSACTRQLQQGLESAVTGGTMLSAPEVLWRAIVNGDVASVEAIIRQGGLVSGRTQDPSGHSVLWDAVAFQRPEVAILLLRLFPPDMLHGVALGELHQRNGNSLLHLVSSFQQFDSQSEGLFAMLFERMPEALRMHRNLKGQSFLHVAAGRRNFWVLRYAAARGLASLFSVADSVGYTPRKLLEQHLAQLHIQPPQLRAAFGDTRLPTWCTFGSLKPGRPGESRPFSDVCVEVEWKGTVTKLDAHRVILATGSPLWHQQLRERGTQGLSEPQALQVECPSVEVVTYALGYLYTGDLEGCSFQKDAERFIVVGTIIIITTTPATTITITMILINITIIIIITAVINNIINIKIINIIIVLLIAIIIIIIITFMNGIMIINTIVNIISIIVVINSVVISIIISITFGIVISIVIIIIIIITIIIIIIIILVIASVLFLRLLLLLPASLLELLQLCRSCKLPAVLMAFALESLLLEIRPSMIPSLLLEAKQYQLPAQARQFLALQFLIIDEAWQAAAEAEVSSASPEKGQGEVSKRSEVLTEALGELERPVSNFLG